MWPTHEHRSSLHAVPLPIPILSPTSTKYFVNHGPQIRPSVPHEGQTAGTETPFHISPIIARDVELKSLREVPLMLIVMQRLMLTVKRVERPLRIGDGADGVKKADPGCRGRGGSGGGRVVDVTGPEAFDGVCEADIIRLCNLLRWVCGGVLGVEAEEEVLVDGEGECGADASCD